MLTRTLLLRWLLGGVLLLGAASRGRAAADALPPETTAALAPEPNDFGWNNDDVTVDLLATDVGSGVGAITYWATGADPILPQTVNEDELVFDIVEEGITVVHFYATDQAGNDEEEQTL